MAPELEVWLFADRVGTLALVEGRLNFRYTPAWLSRPNAVTLSSSLPLQAEPFDDHQTRPFFAGLLPEGQMRRLIARQFQVSGQNDFALLDRIGGECAGAVTFLEPGQELPAPSLRIPRQGGHRFHAKMDSDSTASRTSVPRQAGHLK
ncbi:MAG TPA: HipA N-terminal domain-containing protein [Chromatiaceae bacterium]|nr:HipA N-terminal domain-containing protein [Chromatiaceae bacterium]